MSKWMTDAMDGAPLVGAGTNVRAGLVFPDHLLLPAWEPE
jgi:hypothetical protein